MMIFSNYSKMLKKKSQEKAWILTDFEDQIIEHKKIGHQTTYLETQSPYKITLWEGFSFDYYFKQQYLQAMRLDVNYIVPHEEKKIWKYFSKEDSNFCIKIGFHQSKIVFIEMATTPSTKDNKWTEKNRDWMLWKKALPLLNQWVNQENKFSSADQKTITLLFKKVTHHLQKTTNIQMYNQKQLKKRSFYGI